MRQPGVGVFFPIWNALSACLELTPQG
jgi:hypothetical protein